MRLIKLAHERFQCGEVIHLPSSTANHIHLSDSLHGTAPVLLHLLWCFLMPLLVLALVLHLLLRLLLLLLLHLRLFLNSILLQWLLLSAGAGGFCDRVGLGRSLHSSLDPCLGQASFLQSLLTLQCIRIC